MKKVISIFCVILLIMTLPVYGEKEETAEEENTIDTILQTQLDQIPLEEVEDLIKMMDNEETVSFDLKDIVKEIAGGKYQFHLKSILQCLLDHLFQELKVNLELLAELILLAVVCALLSKMQFFSAEDSVSKMGFYVCFIVIAGLSVKSFMLVLSYGTETVDRLVGFMQSLLPVLFVMLASLGGTVSAVIAQPVILMTVSFIGSIIKTVLVPLITSGGVLAIVNNISDQVHIHKLAKLMRSVTIGLLGLSMTAFLGVITVQGISGSMVDGVALRSMKFASKNFVPIVGSLFADTIDTVIGCGLLVKNAVGIAGMLFMVLIVAFPVLKMGALSLVFKVSAAIAEPIGDSKVSSCLNSISDTMTLLILAVIACGMMFFITLPIIIAMSSITVMMR